MKKLLLIFFLINSIIAKTSAQQQVAITDSLPLEIGGLSMGYHILSMREKEVGDKGNFSRFNIEFYVTNTTTEAKIILYKQGFNLLNSDPSAYLAQFNCVNATGARLTTKEALIQAKACNVIAAVDDKDCSSNKTVQNKRFVQIGYWIKAGETIATKGVVIVPLNQKPDMKVTALYKNNSLLGSISSGRSNNNQLPDFGQAFLKLKNFSTNTYLNNQNGPANCSNIDDGWWSAQWQILAVANTNYYLIKNKWKNIFLNNEYASGYSTFSDQALNSMWIIETTDNGNTYTIKNAGNNTYLTVDGGTLQCNNNSNFSTTAKWIFEQ